MGWKASLKSHVINCLLTVNMEGVGEAPLGAGSTRMEPSQRRPYFSKKIYGPPSAWLLGGAPSVVIWWVGQLTVGRDRLISNMGPTHGGLFARESEVEL